MIAPINQNTQDNSLLQQIDAQKTSRNQENLAPLKELTPQEKQEIANLKQRDREVKAHEQAHKQAGGQHVRGAVNYDYKTGPDGRQYAVGGEVSVDTAPIQNDPEATIDKMRTVRRAALAPAQPSAQDLRVASDASRKEMKAQREATATEQEPEGNTHRPSGISHYQNASSLSPQNQGVTSGQGNMLNLIA